MADYSAVLVALRRFQRDLAELEGREFLELTRRWLDVEARLDSEIDALLSEIQLLRLQGASPSRGQVLALERLRQILDIMRDEYPAYADFAAKRISDEQARLSEKSVADAGEILSVGTSRALGSFTRPNLAAVRAMIGLAGDGSPLRSLFERDFPDAAELLLSRLTVGVVAGKGSVRIAADLRSASRMPLRRALTIARTEQLRVYRAGTQATYTQSRVVTGYMRISARDPSVCPGCLAADGRVYTSDAAFAAHVNCRCALIPIIGGERPSNLPSAKDWFSSQGEATQRQMLGASRYELLRSGAIQFDDMATLRTDSIWGDAIQPATVAELRELAESQRLAS